MAPMDEVARHEAISRSLERVGRASVSDLAREFGVSTVTIRKDLSELERRGLLTRVHGGATRTALKDEGSFAYRLQDEAAQKQDIARRAARLVQSGSTVALDSSSTAHFLAHELLELRDLVVVTYSIPTAALFMDKSAATVHLIGGMVRRSSRATSGGAGRSGFKGRIDIGFFGAHSASPETGLGEMSAEELESKQGLAKLCRLKYALVASSKFSATSHLHWWPIPRLDGLITDSPLAPDALDRWRVRVPGIDCGTDRPGRPRAPDGGDAPSRTK